jgi:hypothetical protein
MSQKPSNNNKASISQVSVETCDEAIAQENDYLKLQVLRLEQMVSELVKYCHTPVLKMKPKSPYVCPGCSIHTYSNNIINR